MTEALSAILEELAAVSSDVTTGVGKGITEYRRGALIFGVREAGAVELRLLPEIAEAARRTPDTHASSRGDDWVRFAPHEWDDHARDRLEAWFRVAWRFAGDGGSRT